MRLWKLSCYSIAIKKDNLPEDLEALKLLIKGAEIEKYGKNLVDFEPIVIRDVVGNVTIIESQDSPCSGSRWVDAVI